jgi:copper transport protein
VGPVVLAVALMLGTPGTALAHALAQSSIPADGATLQTAPADVTITFGEQPDPALSTITVIDTAGRSWTAGPTAVVPDNPLQLRVPLKALPKGVYTVTWRTVSSVDGHLASGAFAFGVRVPPGANPHRASTALGPAPPSAAAVVARLVLYLGLVAVLGAVVLAVAMRASPPRMLRMVIAVASALNFVGALAVVAVQISGAGVGLGEVFASSFGRALIERIVPSFLLLIVGVLLLVRERWWRGLAPAAALLSLASMVIDVLFSHAAAQVPSALNEFAQALHIAAVGVWIGGLVALLAVIAVAPPQRRTHAARTLSFLAGIGLLVVAATGVFRAVIEVQTWGNLVGTAFGALVLLKVGLLLILSALGALNRYRNLPRMPAALRRLRTAVSAEVLVAVGALTVAAALVNVSPPIASPAAAASAQPAVATGSDFGTTVRARLTVSPGNPGINAFRLEVNDYDTGQPVNASQVSMTFTLPNQSLVGSSSLTLKRTSAGVYTAQGGNLALAGTWHITVLIERGALSVDVPLQVSMHSVAPVVTRTAFPGEPTLYNVHLPQGGIVQVYIDPDKAGPVEFHMTFLGNRMQQLQIASASATETAPGGSTQNLVTRRLDVGHFVADANVAQGRTRFDIIASTPSGDLISTYIVLSPQS